MSYGKHFILMKSVAFSLFYLIAPSFLEHNCCVKAGCIQYSYPFS